MTTVRLWLNEYAGSLNGPGDQWFRDLPTVYPPDPGEEVILWPWNANPADGPRLTVQRRVWSSDGRVNCELQVIVVNPDEVTQQTINAQARSGHYRLTQWWTDRDGPVIAGLELAGWQRYRP